MNFASVDHFTKIKYLLVHDPCQNAIVKSQWVEFSADFAHHKGFHMQKFLNSSSAVLCGSGRGCDMHAYMYCIDKGKKGIGQKRITYSTYI